MRTAQFKDGDDALFAIVSPPVTTPAPAGVYFVHFDDKTHDPKHTEQYDASWGPKTTEGYKEP